MSDSDTAPNYELNRDGVRDSNEELPLEMTQAVASRLRTLTPARIGLRRTGISVATAEVLDFQLAHARARDAVHAALQPASLLTAVAELGGGDTLLLHSASPDRPTYLQRPDLGRTLDAPSRERLTRFHQAQASAIDYHLRDSGLWDYDLCIVLADGLSALAVERHAVPLLAELLPAVASASPELRLAPISIVEQARVAVGDEIAAALNASLVIVLIGERPGLSSPDSLGAYITWRPKPGHTSDAQRNCISNIRAEGLSYPQAAARLLYYIQSARSAQQTGVALKDPDDTTHSLPASEAP
jgi:ethanolamine ammonia-lyase small subunit